MKVKLNISNGTVSVFNPKDSGLKEKIRTESNFFFALLKELQKEGFHVIKKEMVKDGHLTSPKRYYIRNKNALSTNPFYAIVDPFYMTRDIAKEYRELGVEEFIELVIERNRRP